MAAPMDDNNAHTEASLVMNLHAFVASDLRNNEVVDYRRILQSAQKLTTWLKVDDNREKLPSYVISDFGQVLDHITKEFAPIESPPVDRSLPVVLSPTTPLPTEPPSARPGQVLDLATETLRCLRSACAACARNQAMVFKSPILLDATKSLLMWGLHYLITSSASQTATEAAINAGQQTMASMAVTCLLRSGTQFLGNAVVGQEVNSKLVWEKFSAVFSDLLHCTDVVVCDYVAMVIYNIIMVEKHHAHWLISDKEGQAIVIAVIDHLTLHNSDWCLCVLQTLLTKPLFVQSLFPILQTKERQLVLEVTLHLLENSPTVEQPGHTEDGTTSAPNVSVESIQLICAEFKTNAYRILGLRHQEVNSEKEDTAVLTVTYLDVLCSAAVHPQTYRELLRDVDLLKCSINLLHSIRMIGLEGENIFSNVSKLTDSLSVSSHEQGHPILGLKKNLIRLIGNMSYGNREIQDEVRRLNGLPLIMDHMNIDTRNKFITEWAVMAVRNLCKDNADNQAVIADMKLQGVANNTQLRQQFSVDAHICNDKVVIKKTEANSPHSTSEREEM